MKKTLMILLMALIACMAFAGAKMECSIKTDCGSGSEVLKLSDITGGHAAIAEVNGGFTNKVCCSGVPGLETRSSPGAGTEFMVSLSDQADGHASKTESGFPVNVYLYAPSAISCVYSDQNLSATYDTCLFSISNDTDAHVGNCSAYAQRYWCYSGESVCTINNIYWGIVDDTGNVAPVDTVGVRMPVLMIVQTTNCAGWKLDFEIFKESILYNNTIKGIDMGTVPAFFGGGNLDCYGQEQCYGLGLWMTGDGILLPPVDGNYKFMVKMNNGSAVNPQTVYSDESDGVTVNGSCIAEDPWSYAIDECYFDVSALTAACGAEPASLPDANCNGIVRCQDKDCDGVDDCIDQIDMTAASVERCTGTQRGTAGCVANIDCTNLAWSECYQCAAGQPCESEGGFGEGEWVMERCTEEGENGCVCRWIGGVTPPGCSDDQLSQWDSRFKACIVEEEFPVFDHWNIVAVLMILTGYYAFVLYRRRK